MEYVCGFAAVNKGKHCWINGYCVICNLPYPKVHTVQVGSRLIIADGFHPLRYVDLAHNTVHAYQKPEYKVQQKTIDNI